MAERNADVRVVDSSFRQKESLCIVLDAIQLLALLREGDRKMNMKKFMQELAVNTPSPKPYDHLTEKTVKDFKMEENKRLYHTNWGLRLNEAERTKALTIIQSWDEKPWFSPKSKKGFYKRLDTEARRRQLHRYLGRLLEKVYFFKELWEFGDSKGPREIKILEQKFPNLLFVHQTDFLEWTYSLDKNPNKSARTFKMCFEKNRFETLGEVFAHALSQGCQRDISYNLNKGEWYIEQYSPRLNQEKYFQTKYFQRERNLEGFSLTLMRSRKSYDAHIRIDGKALNSRDTIDDVIKQTIQIHFKGSYEEYSNWLKETKKGKSGSDVKPSSCDPDSPIESKGD